MNNSERHDSDKGELGMPMEYMNEEARRKAAIGGVAPCASHYSPPPRLTDEQRLELAACYAEYCGVDPQDKDDWRTEMVGAKKFVRELMAIWRRRNNQINPTK
jgi:hypothetical protein